MQGNRGSDTRPETALRSALFRLGLRFRKHYRPASEARSRVDVAFPKARVAVFVDGCFWHGCAEHGTTQPRNSTTGGRSWRGIESGTAPTMPRSLPQAGPSCGSGSAMTRPWQPNESRGSFSANHPSSFLKDSAHLRDTRDSWLGTVARMPSHGDRDGQATPLQHQPPRAHRESDREHRPSGRADRRQDADSIQEHRLGSPSHVPPPDRERHAPLEASAGGRDRVGTAPAGFFAPSLRDGLLEPFVPILAGLRR